MAVPRYIPTASDLYERKSARKTFRAWSSYYRAQTMRRSPDPILSAAARIRNVAQHILLGIGQGRSIAAGVGPNYSTPASHKRPIDVRWAMLSMAQDARRHAYFGDRGLPV